MTIDQEEVLTTSASAERELDKSGPRGPIHGVPVGIKDIFYTAGMKTTACSRIYADFIPTYDATAVSRIKEAGGIILGKAVTHGVRYRRPSTHSQPVGPWPTPPVGPAVAPR